MKHIFILLITLLGAAASYLAGFESGIVAFLVLGAALELAFWVLAFRGPRRQK